MNCLFVLLCFLIKKKIWTVLFVVLIYTTIHEAHSITRIIVYVSVKVNLLEFESNLFIFI